MENFTLKDRHKLINLNGRKPKFVNNLLTDFSRDVATKAEELITSLRLRNFDVPGFDVEFGLNVDTAEIEVFRLKNDSMDLRLCGNWSACVPKMELNVFSDGSGSLELYTGSDESWGENKKDFSSSKYKMKTAYEKRGDSFIDGQGGRIGLRHAEDTLIKCLKIAINAANKYKVQAPLNVFAEPECIQLDNEFLRGMGMYTVSSSRNDRDELESGILPNTRLLSLGHSSKTNMYGDIMNDGFVYMELSEKAPCDLINDDFMNISFYNYQSIDDRRRMFRIKPKNYNSFYVVDAGVFEKLKWEWVESNPECKRLPDDVFDVFYVKQAETIIPINDYMGGYLKPIVVTNRCIWSDELELVTSDERVKA